ncbi:MAG: pteridine reductase [Gammaproteobacteria bacterium]|nr:pteridine reductase [Gammaproteobacteria bacterium]
MLTDKVALITGAAHRIGAEVARTLHAEGMRLVLHYRHSRDAAQKLQKELNDQRADSVILVQAELMSINCMPNIVEETINAFGQLDVLINNASTFYPTKVGNVNEDQWDDLLGSNLKAPFFLSQAAAPKLAKAKGCIINIVDVHADRPLKTYPVYSAAKAGLVMLTKALAVELGPDVRVNAVAPGAILWPENIDEVTKQRIISRTLLKRKGDPSDIAKAILYLIKDAGYMSGQVLTVDGGRSLRS